MLCWFSELGFPKFSQSDLKIGHGGTLDRDATGVIAIGIGMGCKYLSKMLHSKKVFNMFSFKILEMRLELS